MKGPTGKIMRELGMVPSARAVAQRYGELLDMFIADTEDAATMEGLSVPVRLAPTLMTSLAEKIALARVVLEAATALQ